MHKKSFNYLTLWTKPKLFPKEIYDNSVMKYLYGDGTTKLERVLRQNNFSGLEGNINPMLPPNPPILHRILGSKKLIRGELVFSYSEDRDRWEIALERTKDIYGFSCGLVDIIENTSS